MKKWTKIIMVFLLMLLPLETIKAEESSNQGPAFTIEPVFPKNQIDNEAGYFHLDIRDKKKQTIDVVVHNNSKKEQAFEIYFNIAKTNRNGLIVYEDDLSEKPNHTLPYDIEKHVKLSNQEMKVPAQSQKKLSMTLDYADLDYPGILMGALTVREHLEPETQGISHQYQYTMGVVLSQDGRKDLPGSKTFEMNDVSLGLDGGHKVLDYYVDNLENNIARDLNFKTTLSNLDTEQLIFNEKLEDFSIAPNGRLPLRLDWLKKEVKPGNYRLKLELNDGQEVWTHDFKVEQERADNLNAEASYKVRIPAWTFPFCVMLGFLTIVNTIYLMQRQNKREE